MRRLWLALVHGRNSRQAEDAPRGVDDLGDNYQWVMNKPDRDGDIWIELQYHNGKRWEKLEGSWAMGTHNFETEVPKVKKDLITKAKSSERERNKKRELELVNQRWVAKNL